MNQSIIETYLKARKQTEKIVDPLEIEDFVVQPNKDVSPPKWHLGHTTWFFETFFLNEFNDNYKFYNPKFQEIFNSYYKSVGPHWVQAQRGNLSRPTVGEIIKFRHQIDEKVIDYLKTNNNERALKVLAVGIEHEEQHLELLLMDIKSIFAQDPIEVIYQKSILEPEEGLDPLSFNLVEAGLIEIGAKSGGFSFDNEGPRHKVFVAPFKLANRPITNGEYLNFINDGGYNNPAFWTSDGWDFRVKENWGAPLYWRDGAKFEFTLNGLKELNHERPVTHISFYEADAYANWAGKRLPTEFEWESAALEFNVKSCVGVFLESGQFCSVFENRKNQISPFYDLFGSAWEWTSSAYLPYPGFKREKGPFGEYNGKFMCNQKVLKGGSFATPKSHIRSSYRNFYHPEKRWAFTGFRLAEDL